MINIEGRSYLDVQEAAERLGVKPETLYAYVSRGILQSYKQGIRRRRLYLRSEIESLLKLRPVEYDDAGAVMGVREVTDAPKSAYADFAQFTGGPAIPDLPRADDWAAER